MRHASFSLINIEVKATEDIHIFLVNLITRIHIMPRRHIVLYSRYKTVILKFIQD